jgi:hypothetical protein
MEEIMNLMYTPTQDPPITLALRTANPDLARKILAQIEETKSAILNEFQGIFETHEHVLQLALIEAEALAWQSGIPQLVFPTLATEKAQAAAAWHARQRFLDRMTSALSFAA